MVDMFVVKIDGVGNLIIYIFQDDFVLAFKNNN